MTSQNCQTTPDIYFGEDLQLEIDLETIAIQPDDSPHHHTQQYTHVNMNIGSASVYSHIGKRAQNLDRFDYLIRESYELYAIYDGHGTRAVSEHLRHILLALVAGFLDNGTEFPQAVMLGFAQVEQQIIALQNGTEGDIGGSTALLCMLKSGMVYTVNLGDSRAAVISLDGQMQFLNRTHTLIDPEENERVCQRGGVIIHRGSSYRLNGELTLSRSFGDLKHKPFLSSTPDIYAQKSEQGSFLIMASDGFWDEADETIYNSIFHCEKAENMAFNLYSSLRRRPRDNSTVICVRLL